MQLLAAVAELERETSYEQMNKNKMIRWRRLDIFNGETPWGYFWNRVEKRLEVDAKTGASLPAHHRRLFEPGEVSAHHCR